MTLQLNNATNNVQIDFDATAGTNRTVTFPDASGTVALEGAAGGLGGNISRATLFRLTQNVTTDNIIIENWAAPNQAGESAGVGGAVDQISGVFTFPETGIWLVILNVRSLLAAQNTGHSTVTELSVNSGTDWNTRAAAVCGNGSDLNQAQTMHSIACFDIENTATHRVRFRTGGVAAGSTIMGSGTQNNTVALFLRLGDT